MKNIKNEFTTEIQEYYKNNFGKIISSFEPYLKTSQENDFQKIIKAENFQFSGNDLFCNYHEIMTKLLEEIKFCYAVC